MERTDRVILHCDCNAFYASVECLLHPAYRDVPMAVCGDPENRRGIVLAKNEKAKRFGVQTAETIWQARRKCPELVLAPPHRDQYAKYSKQVNAIYQRYTDLVEPFGIDESWLDVTGSQKLFGTGKEIADRLREEVKRETGLTISVGVSFNKIFAKLGSDYRKPDATTVISRENYREILWPQPVGNFFYVGRATAEKLKKLHIYTIGELARADVGFLKRSFGVHGEDLHRSANGEDTSPVRRWGDWDDVKSVGHGVTFRRNIRGEDDVSLAVTELADWVSTRLRLYEMKAYGVKVEITTPEFRRISRQRRVERSFVTAQTIRRIALKLIQEAGFMNREIRLLTVTAIYLAKEDAPEQVSIFDMTEMLSPEPKNNSSSMESNSVQEEKIERTMDAIRKKYGTKSIGYAHSLGNDLGLSRRGEEESEK